MKKTMKWMLYAAVLALVFLLPYIGTKSVKAAETVQESEGDVQEGEYNGLTYLYNNDKVVITGYVGENPDVVIPETINGIEVTDIAERAFAGNETIRTVAIEASIKIIPLECFSSTRLLSVSLPDTVTVIDNFAFSGISELAEIHLPKNIEKIGYGAFAWTDIKEIVIPSAVQEMGEMAFVNCKNLKYACFLGNPYIESIIFDGCDKLEEVVWPDTVHGVSFQNCHTLSSVRLPDGMTEIEEYAFLNCYCLTELYIPDSVTEIQEKAFDGCRFLTVYGSEGSCAEEYAMEHEIPFSSEEMPGKKVTYQESNEFSYLLYDENCMISGYGGGESDLVIPAEIDGHLVTHLAPKAFFQNQIIQNLTIEAQIEELPNDCFYWTSIQNIVLPDSVTTIGERCFQLNDKLESIALPKGVTTLSEYAFANCSNLVSINLPENITKLEKCCFQSCERLETVIIPSTVTDMEECVFGYCQNLKSATIEKGIQVLPMSTFEQCKKTGTCFFARYFRNNWRKCV